jgi:hypothetical protein
MDDRTAIERYRYLLRTAPPGDIERAHAEAFASLTPEQRQLVLRELSAQVPPSERPTSDDPTQLARAATRAELRQPGTMERTFGQVSGPGLGGMFLSTLAGAFVGTAIAGAIFDDSSNPDSGTDASDQSADSADSGPDPGTDSADADAGGDGGGDLGGDFGGGDFGGDIGGDFGGGDFGGF